MGKINLGRVVIGGIVAGIIIDIFENVLNGIYLAGQWSALMNSINRAPVGTNGIIAFNVIGLVTGLAAIWTYAAIRPRFGEGPTTAFIAAIFIWIVAYVLSDASSVITGIYPLPLAAILIGVGLVEIVLATMAGAYFYKETETTPQREAARA